MNYDNIIIQSENSKTSSYGITTDQLKWGSKFCKFPTCFWESFLQRVVDVLHLILIMFKKEKGTKSRVKVKTDSNSGTLYIVISVYGGDKNM